MKKVLVEGAAGFIGFNLVSELLQKQYNIYALIEKGDENSRSALLSVNADINVIDNFSHMLNNVQEYPVFDYIYHLASVGVRPDFNDIDLICDVNIKMGCKLIDFAETNMSGVLVNFGSCFEYGDHGNQLLKEDMECKPESLYAISKNAATNLVTTYAKSREVSMITVRPFGVFGKGESSARLAPSIIASCLRNQKINTTSGEQIRDFVNVTDLVKAIIQLAESRHENYGIYNVCSNNPVKVKDFIMEIVEVCGFDKALIGFGNIPYRQNEAMVFAGDNTKLQKVIGYNFPDNHKDGIIDIFSSVKETINIEQLR